jgi:hypothetical protein
MDMNRLTCSFLTLLAACGSSSKSGNSPDAAVDAGSCPDQHGAYSVALTGQGCGDLNASAPQCITQSACTITLASSASTGGNALNGSAMLGLDGAFTGAAITEGTVNRTGCVGMWNASTSVLTVDCGGVGTSQSCRATLTRTSKTCP